MRRPDHVVIDVAGVGYSLAVSAETLRDVPPPGSRATLHSHLIVRDDALNLYGFATPEERELFLSLTSVSGVGPKVALAALSGGPVRELLIAIATSDAKRFQAVPGIGKRTAERIIVELREKVAGQLEGDGEGITVTRAGAERPALAGARGPREPGLHADRSRTRPRPRRRRDPRRADPVSPSKRVRSEGGMTVQPGEGIRTPGLDSDSLRPGPAPTPEGAPAAPGREAEEAAVDVVDARAVGSDEELDRSLRPTRLADFVNQVQVTEQLGIFIEAARRRSEPLDHVLLAGPPGLGKTSLAHIIAHELEAPLVQTAGPALERKADIAAFLTGLQPGSVFFVDEIHRLGRAVEETLYPAMEDRTLPVVLGQGAGARTVTLDLPALHPDRRHHPHRPADDSAP